jgi:Ulp1 family protease
MCNVPQQDITNTTDCGVFVCMYCNFILNDCKLDFNQHNITKSHLRDRMILSILLVKATNDKDKNNNDKVTISAIKMKWNNKQKI